MEVFRTFTIGICITCPLNSKLTNSTRAHAIQVDLQNLSPSWTKPTMMSKMRPLFSFPC